MTLNGGLYRESRQRKHQTIATHVLGTINAFSRKPFAPGRRRGKLGKPVYRQQWVSQDVVQLDERSPGVEQPGAAYGHDAVTKQLHRSACMIDALAVGNAKVD